MLHDTVLVNAPLRQVYDQWTRFEEFPRFMHGVVAVEPTGARHLRWRTSIAGVRREFDTEIVDRLPDERIAWRSVGGGVHQRGVVTFTPVDARHTRVRLAMEVEPEGVTERTADALGILSARVSGDLLRFKHFVEDRHAATGAERGRIRPSEATGPQPAGNGAPRAPASAASRPAGRDTPRAPGGGGLRDPGDSPPKAPGQGAPRA
ncbi:SRPBCC family protein [Streptomyces griseus]|uniref:SRPBCC family protein n=1 Tax=Streptomyces griseus TaxID=1911 RepID=UPI0007C76AA5|nr:SRPBCC family protein [Streptomyces griseus]